MRVSYSGGYEEEMFMLWLPFLEVCVRGESLYHVSPHRRKYLHWVLKMCKSLQEVYADVKQHGPSRS